MSSAKITLIGLYNYSDGKIFDDMILPEGIDRKVLISNILLRGGEFETIYPDPDFLKSVVKVWSLKWYDTFEKWYSVLTQEYNPLENYDRIEDFNESGNTESKTDSTDKISAYNSDKLRTNTHDDNNSLGSYSSNRNGRAHGNIGVTTSQQMLQSELEVRYNNLYDMISDVFIREHSIPVY